MIDYSQSSDIELVETIRAHDPKGLDELFRRYAAPLHRFASQITQNQEDAKELVADLFIQLWTKGNDLAIHSQVKAYLYTALRNLCLNHLRIQQLPTDNLAKAASAPSTAAADTDRLIQEAETTRLMELILADLPPQRKLVFQMHRIDGFSYKEIAQILSISEHTVHRHMVSAVKQLAAQYPKGNPDFLLAVLLLTAPTWPALSIT